ncbi:hypothetical protein ANANG_G00182440 [Anguilla anguilla]|uniref:Regulation of nuclear pre-mRNA domain-containing protein 2 n=1 Tax=Anguilla anguilla TaxID=7936 RepID=A0A9D3RTH5_ANGAN|nr:hypothetical protein ANANG_G00182440 [Anguilla anguilla]
MAAGTGAASGRTGRGSSAALQSSLDRRFQGVSNTMESIQGLSNWCIENKKYHNFIVRYWMKWLKKSGASQMLNLFYVANDVIQNCKRKNAMIYRSSFSEVLPEAALLVKDPKVRKSVERILTIWEERSVYPEELIAGLRASLARKAPPSGRSSAPPNPKAALKSKILAEFAPQAFIEKLSQHRRSLEEAELKEKQLAALRVDVCSTEALKRLKDKAGGKKFSKDFEEGSTKLQDFVGFLEQQLKGGPPLLEALGNADVFYEMQYKEVKIIANAYKTFANRVTHLKRKLDALKSTLPGWTTRPSLAVRGRASPTGSESPFRDMEAAPGADDLDGLAMDDGDEAGLARETCPARCPPRGRPAPAAAAAARPGEKDNRDVEDMELSEEEEPGSAGIIGGSAPRDPRNPSDARAPAPTLPVNLANVDLGKISSILSSLTSAMKSTGVSPVSRTSPGPRHAVGSRPGPEAPRRRRPTPNPLASILSRWRSAQRASSAPSPKRRAPAGRAYPFCRAWLEAPLAPASPSNPPPQRHLVATPPAPRGRAHAVADLRGEGPRPPSAPTPKPRRGRATSRAGEQRGRGREEEEPEATPRRLLPPAWSPRSTSSSRGTPGSGLQPGPGARDGQGAAAAAALPGRREPGRHPVRDEAPGTPTQDEMMDEPGPRARRPRTQRRRRGPAPRWEPAAPSASSAGRVREEGDGRGLSPPRTAPSRGGPGSPGTATARAPQQPGVPPPPRPDARTRTPAPGGALTAGTGGATAGEHYPLRPGRERRRGEGAARPTPGRPIISASRRWCPRPPAGGGGPWRSRVRRPRAVRREDPDGGEHPRDRARARPHPRGEESGARPGPGGGCLLPEAGRGGEPHDPPALFKDLPHHGGVKDHFPSRQAPSTGLHPPCWEGPRRPQPPPSSLGLPSPRSTAPTTS